jgi:hypothetical protein
MSAAGPFSSSRLPSSLRLRVNSFPFDSAGALAKKKDMGSREGAKKKGSREGFGFCV